MTRISSEKAIRHWYKTKRYWEKSAKKFERKVMAIEEPALREAVACVIELTCGGGASFEFSASEEVEGFNMKDLVIEDDYLDVLEKQYTMEGIENARTWIEEATHAKSMGFFMHAFGSVHLKGHEDSGDDEDAGCISDGMVISLIHSEIVGIYLGGNPADPRSIEAIPQGRR